ncbi:hypothetical protein CU098_001064, partial [Rhizopus stolonifer]
GYLYMKDEHQWLWRLFRFDGSFLICLSPKKIKLAPSTQFNIRTHPFHSTSPLLATPKDRKARLSCLKHECIASYYQLPKWTIHMKDVSYISILKPKSLFSMTSKCFSIRTYDGQCYIMKANKQQDLERWIFVLSKMWGYVHSSQHVTPPILSNEKVLWIEAWIKSLAELAAQKQEYNVNYFQDAHTILSHSSNQQEELKAIRYHHSVKGHPVQFVRPLKDDEDDICLADIRKSLKKT